MSTPFMRYVGGVRTERAPDIVARIERWARERPGGVVATDGDGTLWSGDVGEDLYFALLESGRITSVAEAALRTAARAEGIDDSGSGSEVGRRIYTAYQADRFPEEKVCELMVWCFAGWSIDEMTHFAAEVVASGGLADRLTPELLTVLEYTRSRGIEFYLVSASPRSVVEAAGRVVGIAPSHIVAATPLLEGARLRAGVDRPIPYAAGKIGRLRERIGARALYAAFGDSAFDVAMLADALVPVAVRPKPRLRALLAQGDHGIADPVELAAD
jgi:phosphatidylglycerophosphatase C